MFAVHAPSRAQLLAALRDRARRMYSRHVLTPQERVNLAAGRRPASVFSASMGHHPYL
ncbi:hypothetical protein [Nocardia sp. alder85J]|uniref:hypothetical protein n=1 Tax=Nocardia sp. alder85J TaxID=2862949 RepID=UPI001CD1E04D|nr:hypothetical protein [Nocardia sp. alder85J]MCX4098668.1 hypothetical protein [Nocardia sp. alder85J]